MAAETKTSSARRTSRISVCKVYFLYRLCLSVSLGHPGFCLGDDRSGAAGQARVKDISSIEGIRDNQLVGYGIVVGLQGTGDSQQTGFPMQTLAATLLRMGVSVPASSIRVQNLAAVFVSATLPPFARPGTKLDITVSSAGDARSLEGGLLLMTPLYGADGKIYAQAQGSAGGRWIFGDG